MTTNFITRNKTIILYGAIMALLLFFLKWLELRFIIIDHAFEIYVGAIAVIFTSLGIWLSLRLSRPKIKTVIVEKEIRVRSSEPFIVNETELNRIGISKRELEVLGFMAEGLSNKEIADRLFVSENTVKTHASRLFEKLEVNRRTQAIEKAKRLFLIP